MPGASGSIWMAREPFQLPPRDPVLYYLQRVRDEAHRFAITTHRAGRSKTLVTSELDEIDGVGSARKRALLNHFGSARGGEAGGADRSGTGAGHQPGDGAPRLCPFPPRREPGGQHGGRIWPGETERGLTDAAKSLKRPGR